MNQIQPQMVEGGKLLTGEFTGSFLYVFTMHQYGQNRPEFSVEMLFDPNDPTIQMMSQMIQQAAQTKWGAQLPPGFKSPIRDGNLKAAKYPEMAGKYTVKASSKTRKPLVIDRNKAEILDPSEVYPGAMYRAVIDCFAYDTGSNGVAFDLNILQKTQDGTPLAGSVRDPNVIPALAPMPQQAPQVQPGMVPQQQPGMVPQQQAPQVQPGMVPQQQPGMVPQQQIQPGTQTPGMVPVVGANVDLNNF